MTKEKTESVRGGRWGVFQKYDITDVNDPTSLYLRRWYLLKTPFFGIYLHAIYREDHDRNLHDHPWSFISFILSGGYIEERIDAIGDPIRINFVARFNRLRHGEYHRILKLDIVPTYSLVFVGRRRSSWGFVEDGAWIDHRTYVAKLRAAHGQ